MKFNIEEYKGDYVMHCKTEEEARSFCKYLDSIGRTWASGGRYVDNLHWSEYGPDTIYWFNSGCYDYINYYTDAIILEWSDFMEEEAEAKDLNKKGIDYSKEVFELLGVKPNEVFRVGSFNSADYKITKDLTIFKKQDKDHWTRSMFVIADFLNGRLSIYKKPTPTEMEQLAIDYALACGHHWLTKDKDGGVRSYVVKPFKDDCHDVWFYAHKKDRIYDCSTLSMEIGLPISFISWEDDEPYYIGD